VSGGLLLQPSTMIAAIQSAPMALTALIRIVISFLGSSLHTNRRWRR
jgi:hypothetical protein